MQGLALSCRLCVKSGFVRVEGDWWNGHALGECWRSSCFTLVNLREERTCYGRSDEGGESNGGELHSE